MLNGKFITLAEFAHLKPLEVYHKDNGVYDLPEHPAELRDLHITFRGVFTLDELKPLKIHYTADDYCKLYVNGKFVSQGPAQGYFWGYNHCESDITELLTLGENEIIAEVYYCGLVNRAYNSAELRCGFICDILDGESAIFSTDESWKCRLDRSFIGTKTVGYKTQYLEDRDFRISPTEWERVRVRNHDYTFAEKPISTVQLTVLEPVSFLEREGESEETRSIVYDFGREVTAGLRMTLVGKDGDEVILRCAEELDNTKDKSVVEGVLTPETQIRWKSRAFCEYNERMLLADGENFVDQYDYKAFRYAELILPEGVSVEGFSAVERHFPFDDGACLLETSDKVLSGVFEMCKLGVKLGSQEVYVDCPGREKGQYAGDLTITSASQLWLTGDTELFLKSVRNQIESTRIDEGIMAVAPGSYMQEIADYSLQFPILALRAYDFTGDREQLGELLTVCDRMLTSFETYQREDGLLDGVTGKWNLVDWPWNLRDNYDFELTKPIGKGVHNVMNAFYIGAVLLTERIIDTLGLKLEPGAKRSDALIEAYERAFWNPELGLYVDREGSSHASLHANVLPLYFGFARPESHRAIVELIRQKKFEHSGVYMAYFILKALARIECWQDIWQLITMTGVSSWYNMAREGATVCIEAWSKSQKSNCSLCHPWASAPISVLIEDLLGITPKAPGFTDVDVRPHLPNSLERLNMRVPLPDGRHIEFEWERGFYNYRILKG